MGSLAAGARVPSRRAAVIAAIAGKRNSRMRGVRRRDALLNHFRRIGGQCLRSPHIASGANHRPVPRRLGFHCKKERQQTEAKSKRSAPEGKGSGGQS